MKNITIKLGDKDRDILDYLKDKPKTWIIKEALREYMSKDKKTDIKEGPKKAASADLFESVE